MRHNVCAFARESSEYTASCGKRFEIRRNARRKRVALGLDANGVYYVAVPATMPAPEIKGAVEKFSRQFIERTESRAKEQASLSREYEDGKEFFLRGKPYPLRIKSPDAPLSFMFSGSEFIACGFRDKSALRRAFGAWYARRLEETLRGEFPFWCKKIGAGPKTVRIKRVSSLWGSCSASGNITFSTRLILLPPRLMEYVMIHELCHFFEMNHSQNFWRRVALFCPDYKERRAELSRDAAKYDW